jgi:hypothetical protein
MTCRDCSDDRLEPSITTAFWQTLVGYPNEQELKAMNCASTFYLEKRVFKQRN